MKEERSIELGARGKERRAGRLGRDCRTTLRVVINWFSDERRRLRLRRRRGSYWVLGEGE